MAVSVEHYIVVNPMYVFSNTHVQKIVFMQKKHYTEEIFYMVTSEKVRFLPKIPEHFEF